MTDLSEFVIRDLLDAGCVNFNTRRPFTLTSGRISPVYVDIRRLISFPKERTSIVLQLAGRVQEVGDFDVIAGGETAGIPFAAWVAAKRRLPMIYVRKEAKAFGQKSQIEGVLHPKSRVALIEDLVSEGTSKVTFVKAIRAAGGDIKHCFVVFDYGIFPDSQRIFAELGIKMHGLVTWHEVVRTAKDLGHFTTEQFDSLLAYLEAPEDWRPSA